jgi:hypothetical protein
VVVLLRSWILLARRYKISTELQIPTNQFTSIVERSQLIQNITEISESLTGTVWCVQGYPNESTLWTPDQGCDLVPDQMIIAEEAFHIRVRRDLRRPSTLLAPAHICNRSSALRSFCALCSDGWP